MFRASENLESAVAELVKHIGQLKTPEEEAIYYAHAARGFAVAATLTYRNFISKSERPDENLIDHLTSLMDVLYKAGFKREIVSETFVAEIVLNTDTKETGTLLHLAAGDDLYKSCFFLTETVKKIGENPDYPNIEKDPRAGTALDYAISCGSIKSIALLLMRTKAHTSRVDLSQLEKFDLAKQMKETKGNFELFRSILEFNEEIRAQRNFLRRCRVLYAEADSKFQQVVAFIEDNEETRQKVSAEFAKIQDDEISAKENRRWCIEKLKYMERENDILEKHLKLLARARQLRMCEKRYNEEKLRDALRSKCTAAAGLLKALKIDI